ncbi:peptidoglycan DD-metalloendopeptidase family protein [Patescibacteria group bacterium]|nr:peptidoglycan DD-metalloendopeptidase family protein [Patescibacteria group bacterium]
MLNKIKGKINNRNQWLIQPYLTGFIILLLILMPIFSYAQNADPINTEIKELNKKIEKSKNKIKDIQAKQQQYSQNISQKQKEKASLNNQLSILDNRLAKTKLDIETVETEINQTNLEIKKVNIEIDDQNEKIQEEKEHISNILKFLYKQNQGSTLEILLLNDSLTDFINQVKYLEDLNGEVVNSLDVLKKYKKELENNKSDLDVKNKEIKNLKQELEEKIVSLDEEQNNKLFILEEVKGSEREYQRLLSRAKQEQEEASAEILNSERAVRAKIAQLSKDELKFNDKGLIWPVPKNVITAYFHDPDYPFRYIFEHPAIDIRAGQGTNLKVAASGYVARTKDAGKGYSYIMIIHGNDLSTVYGHVSKIFVKENEYVVQGQSIGQTGGMPGTSGAGRLTTGPHLHFEVRLNGIPVNPLEYLP